MAKIQRFEDLEMWKSARSLAGMIYCLANKGSFSKDFGLRDQICRAAVSIMSNIAEGFDRHSDKSFSSFLDIARGSAAEVRSQLYVALDIGYITQDEFQSAYNAVVSVGMMITKFIQYLRPFDDKTIRR